MRITAIPSGGEKTTQPFWPQSEDKCIASVKSLNSLTYTTYPALMMYGFIKAHSSGTSSYHRLRLAGPPMEHAEVSILSSFLFHF